MIGSQECSGSLLSWHFMVLTPFPVISDQARLNNPESEINAALKRKHKHSTEA
ncbi:MAG: hypothetical protein ACI8V5_004850 [Limisphaerales bacterium]